MAEDGDFTGYVRWLDSASEAPDTDRLGRLWVALRKALKSEIERRGMWHSPPSYLGISGWSSWSQTEPGRRGSGRLDDALEELTADCYSYIFLTRFQSLKAQLKVKPAVEGLVFRNIRNFLHERQKRHDPLGFRVFEHLRLAVRGAVDEGRWTVLAGSPAIRNQTVVAFEGSASPVEAAESRLSELAAVWAEDLLPDLVTARGKARVSVLERLRGHLDAMPGEGAGAFRFKPLVDALKHAVRERWRAMFGQTWNDPSAKGGVQGVREISRMVWPETDFEDRESFARLVEGVDQELARLAVNPRTRDYLSRLWRFLTSYAGESAHLGTDHLPSRRRIARELEIPRERLPGLLETLGELIQTYRESVPSATRGSATREVSR